MSIKKEKSPFLPSFGNRPDPLVGREKILNELVEGLESEPGYPSRSSLIIGPRGIGKTALLLELQARAQAKDFVVAQVVANDHMNEDVLQLIQINGERYANTNQRKVSGISASALGFSFGLTFNTETRDNYGFRVKLELLVEALESHGKGILILVDEVQASSRDMRELTTTYQYLVGKGKNIALSMAGLPHAISSVLNDDVLTFLNRAYRIELQPLSLLDIRTYYLDAITAQGKTISITQAEQLAKASEGYPYLFQLIGFNLLRNMGTREQVTEEIIDLAINDSHNTLIDAVYAPTLKPLSETDIEFLKAMSQDEGPSAISDIQKRMGVNNAYSQKYRMRLLSSGVIASPRRGMLEITIPFLKDYLRGL